MKQNESNTKKDIFRLSNNNSNTSSNNSKTSKSSEISDLSEIEPFQAELYTIQELKEKTNEKNFETEYIYDLNERLNYEAILQILENKNIEDKNRIEKFNEIMYKLSYDDRIKLLNKYKNLFDNDEIQKKNSNVLLRQIKRLKEVFISIIKDILYCKPKDIIELFHTKYFVETQKSNIPFLEGNDEFIFANLINDIYDTFIVKSNNSKNNIDKSYDDSKYLSNIINKNIEKPNIMPIVITKDTDKKNEVEMKDNLIEQNEINTDFIYQKFVSNKYLLKPILEIYCSKEFQEKHEEFLKYNPQYNNDKRVKYIYEIILEVLFYYCIYLNEVGKMKIISAFATIFYEEESKKINIINDSFNIEIKDENGNNENLELGLKNKDYNVYIYNIPFKLNLYDYNNIDLFNDLSNVSYIKEIKDKKLYIENKLNDCTFWTIQKHARVNSLYHNTHLNQKFKEEVDSMLKHTVLNNVFNEISIFNDCKYPFLKEEFIKEVHNSIIYVPLPTKLILGLTIKKMSIIVINKGRHSKVINEQDNKNSKFILKLAECCFYKITLIHEINFHYFLIILYYNGRRKFLYTPEKVFKNYTVENNLKEKLDFGDKGEALIFGTKISVLYLKAMINIINLELWEKNKNLKPKKLGDKFMEINKEAKNSEIYLKNLIDLSEFTKSLYELINKEKNLKAFNLNEDIGKIFSRGKILNIDINYMDFNGDFGQLLPRGVCLNAYIPRYKK